MKKFLLTSLFSFITLFLLSTFANAELNGMCDTDSNGSIVISANGKAGSQTYSWEHGGDSGTQKAPFNYANGYINTESSITANGNFTDACQTQPLFYKLNFFKVALCKTDPYNGSADPDYTSCVNIFNNSSGKVIIIEPGKEVDLLDGNLVLPVGSYKYLTLVVSNKIQIKHKQKYVYADGTRAHMYGNGDTGGSNSDTDLCYTVDVATSYSGVAISHDDGANMQYDSNYTSAHGVTLMQSANTSALARMECTSNAVPGSDYAYATEIIDNFNENKTFNASGRHITYHSMLDTTGVDVELGATLMKNDNTSVATTAAEALRIGAHFKYTNPINISENTIGFKLNFATTRGVSLDAGQDGSNHIWGVKVGADPFTVEVQTKTRRVRGAWR